MESVRTLHVQDDKDGRVLLAVVAHELRTPISTLANAAAILRDVVGTNQVGVAALQLIERQTRVLTRLVSDLVDTTRIDTGKFSATFELIDVTEVLRWAAHTCKPAMQSRSHNFQALLTDGPLYVMADRDRLTQVFVNLLDNAIKYTPRGGMISVFATAEGAQAVVRVRDSGVGISDDALPCVFELFSQVATTKPMSNGGVGIGLALARSIVNMHKGTIQVRSEGSDTGSEFTVRLPLHSRRF